MAWGTGSSRNEEKEDKRGSSSIPIDPPHSCKVSHTHIHTSGATSSYSYWGAGRPDSLALSSSFRRRSLAFISFDVTDPPKEETLPMGDMLAMLASSFSPS